MQLSLQMMALNLRNKIKIKSKKEGSTFYFMIEEI